MPPASKREETPGSNDTGSPVAVLIAVPPVIEARAHSTGSRTRSFAPSTLRFPKAYFTNHEEVPTKLQNLAHAIRSTFVAPAETHRVLGKEKYNPVIWDSGASICVSPSRDDFVGPLKKPSIGHKLQGLGQGLKIQGLGHVAWSFVDTTGMLRTLKLPALHVPKATSQLLSTSALLAKYPDEHIRIEGTRLVLSGSSASSTSSQTARNPIEVLTDPKTNLPMNLAYADDTDQVVSQAFNSAISAVSHANMNLSPAQKELLCWHFRLGHLSQKKIQFLMRTGVLPTARALVEFNPPPPSSSSALCVPPANTESNTDAQLQESSVKWFTIERELSNQATFFQVKRSPSTTSFAQLAVASPLHSARKTPRLSTGEAPSLWTTPQGISLLPSRFISTRTR